MGKRADGPTSRIVEFARQQPGGVIRWRDADAIYLKASASARKDTAGHYHISLARVFDRYFTQVRVPLSEEEYRDMEEDHTFRTKRAEDLYGDVPWPWEDMYIPLERLKGYWVLTECLGNPMPLPVSPTDVEEPIEIERHAHDDCPGAPVVNALWYCRARLADLDPFNND